MEPQTIVDQPIPLLVGGMTDPSGNVTNPVMSDSGGVVPTTNLDKVFHQAAVAQETISQSLNTETKRILANYTFESLGAFEITSPIHPLANIKIDGEGIAATDANGNPTFTLDGETGDATFSGTVKASDVVVVDANGLVSLASFASGSVGDSPNTFFTNTTYVKATGSDLVFTLVRSTRIFITLALDTANAPTDASADMSGRVIFSLFIDDVKYTPEIIVDTFWTHATGDRENTGRLTHTLSLLETLAAGTHTLNFRYLIQSINNLTANLPIWQLSYLVLGS